MIPGMDMSGLQKQAQQMQKNMEKLDQEMKERIEHLERKLLNA